ncbi:Ig-like domain-containing protein [Tropicimonas marinistellae]|uniref:Ig-like domain-containing protein n=1 Tax=Tropicimonas marinistellae TaxID=1739787 RepID=UPI000834EFE6|nr:Ig-like domain-containing protein [Tropicimonas marinistellae]
MADFSLDEFNTESVISTGLIAPIALEFLSDGRMLVVEKEGKVLIADPETGQFETYLDISSVVNSGQERGLLEIAVPPDFDPTGETGDNHIYLFYSRSADTNHAVIGRFEHQENAGGLTSRADTGSEELVWIDTDDISSPAHYGAGLDFGPDEKLWLTTSDKFNTTNDGEGGAGSDDVSVDLESTSGKIIRVNRDGTIPDGTDGWPANPYVDGVIDGPYPSAGVTPDPSIWAYGLRNAFRADWDLENELLYIGEVGGNRGISRDDVHVASLDQAGAFYGWNFWEGVDSVKSYNSNAVFDPDDFPQPDQDLADPANGDYFSAPIYDIGHSSLTGGFVYRGDMFPNAFDGVYFFGNYEENYIRFLELDETGREVEAVHEFSSEISADAAFIVFLGEGPDGALYYINYSATGGQVQRIVYQGDFAPSIDTAEVTDAQGDPTDGFGPSAPLDVTFSATITDADTPLSNVTYSLNFGDGTAPITNASVDPSTGEISVDHTYAAAGDYSAQLSVSDGDNTVFATPFNITVGDPNDAPEILSAVPDIAFGEPSLVVTFTATVDDPDVDDPPQSLTYSWDFGDGSVALEGSPNADGEIVVQHTYTDVGLFNAVLTISDGEAPDVLSDSIPIRVGEVSGLPVTDGLVMQVESFIKIGLGEDGTTVTEWLDQSGNGNNLTAQGDPQLVENATPTGQPAIVFDGVGDAIGRSDSLTSFALGNDPRTMFFVVDYETVTNDEAAGLVYGNDSDNQAFGLTLDGNENDFNIHGWNSDLATDVDGVDDPATGEERGFVSHAVVFDGSIYRHYVNGEQIDSGAASFNTVMERLVIGQNLDGGETPMKVAAALVFNRALSTSEFDAIEEYLQTTYIGETVVEPPSDYVEQIGTPAADTLTGADGQRDGLYGRANNDVLKGLGDDDLLDGEEGDDRLEGGAGNDILRDGTGDDKVFGGAGEDFFLVQGGGLDRFTGGAGADILKLTEALLENGTTDAVKFVDYQSGDAIDLGGASVNSVNELNNRVKIFVGPDNDLVEVIGTGSYSGILFGSYDDPTGGGSDNTPPVAVPDLPVGDEDTTITGQVTATDADGDGVTLSKESDPSNGSVTVEGDGSYSYVPNLNFNGSDSFDVRASDGKGGVDVVTVNVTVVPVNDAPVAADDSGTGPQDTTLTGDLQATDVDGDPLTYSLDVGATSGTANVASDGSWSYEPTAGFFGTDSFTFTVVDGNDGLDIGTVLVTILEANTPPVAVPDTPVGDEDTKITGQVTATDDDDDPVTLTKASDPSNGTVVVASDGSYSYMPNLNFNGSDSFDVLASDGKGGEDTVTVNVTVQPVNDAPVASDDSGAGPQDTTLTGQVSASDVDGDALTYNLDTGASSGTASVGPDGSWSYEPNAGFVGTDSFTYVVDDSNGGVDTGTVSITITNEPDTDLIELTGTPGNDVIAAPDGQDYAISGLAGDDKLYGGNGNDLLIDGDGDDKMFGGGGNDVFVFTGSGDNDRATGGSGEDTFRLSSDLLTNGVFDRVNVIDYVAGQDVIDLNGATYTSVQELSNRVILTVGPDGERLDIKGVTMLEQITFVDDLTGI